MAVLSDPEGGGSVTGTAGRIPFFGSGGAIDEDDAFRWDDTTKTVAIGGAPVANAGSKLQVSDGTAEACTVTTDLMQSWQGANGARTAWRNTGSNAEGFFAVNSSSNVLFGSSTNHTVAIQQNGTTRVLIDGAGLVMNSGQNIYLQGGGIAFLHTSSGGAGVISSTSHATKGTITLGTAATPYAQVSETDAAIADTETALLVRRNVGGTLSLQRVSMGIVDSGGSGFKLLRVPN
jgi:hypothetical protein